LSTAGLLSLTSLALAQDDPSSVLSEFYSSPPTVTGSQLTALASALVSVESTWTDSPKYTSVLEAIYSAAPASVQSYLRTGTWYDSLTAQPWFTGVPGSAQSALSSQEAALISAEYAVLGTPTSTNAAPARATGAMAAAAAGAVGLVGVMAAL